MSKIRKFFQKEEPQLIEEKTIVIVFVRQKEVIDIDIREVDSIDEYHTYLQIEKELEEFKCKYFPKKRIMVVWNV